MTMSAPEDPAPTRRDRLRTQTVEEIRGAARRQLVERGAHGISLRAVARGVGMTAPALYRYFPSLEELITDLIATCYDELSEHLEGRRDAESPGDLGARVHAVCRGFREWSAEHPAEFALTFGTPLPDYTAPPEGPSEEAGRRFGDVFAALFTEHWMRQPFAVPADDEVDPALAASLADYLQQVGRALPIGAVAVYLQCWTRLYGVVSMEMFGHLCWAVSDAEPLFETTLRSMCELIGLGYQPPA